MKILRAVLILAALIAIILALFVYWAASGMHAIKNPPAVNYPEYSENIPAKHRFTVMTYNIGYASGMKNNLGDILTKKEVFENLDKIADCALKNKVDILAMQEIDFNSKRSHYINELKYLAEKLRFPYSAHIYNWDKHYVPYPISISFKKHFGHIESGQAVLSRFPITENNCYFFDKPSDNPFWYNLFYIDRAVQKVKIRLSPSITIDLYNVHLEAFSANTRLKQAKKLTELIKKDFSSGLVLGDFNTLPPGAEKLKDFPDEPGTDFSGDNTVSVVSEGAGLKEILIDKPSGKQFSFPSIEPTRRLDYIFYSNALALVNGFVDIKAGSGSDHLPAVGVFRY